MDGSVFFGWLTEDQQPETILSPAGITGKFSAKLTDATGGLRSNWMLYAFLASCLLVPWLWFTPARGAALFALIYLAAVWGQMAILRQTGGTVHHVILLWPFPHFLIAVAGAHLARRFEKFGSRTLIAALVLIAGCNLVVIGHYYADLVTRGTGVLWTDAINPLFRRLDSVDFDRQLIVTVDWGYSETLCLLSDGQMPLKDISFALIQPSAADTAFIRSLITQPNTVFVDHAADSEQFPGVRQHLERIATEVGYRKEVIRIVKDRNYRPRFEISHYRAGR
jgi:hypothetical protein